MNTDTVAQDTAPKRALVLSGGGGRGAFECGVLEKLTELGWKPDALVGTSIGSMNAAVWAIGNEEGGAEAGTKKVSEMWSKLRTRNMHRFFRFSPWHSLLDRAAWERTLQTYAGEDDLKTVTTPLYIVATDITTGHLVVHTNSKYYDEKKSFYRPVTAIKHEHLLASSAIPYVYPATKIEQAAYWDGAVMYNSPLQPAIDCGASQIFIVLLSPYHNLQDPHIDLPSAPSGLMGKVGHLLDLTITATFENDFERMYKVNRQVRQLRRVQEHREVQAALIGPKDWLPVMDMLRYRQDRIVDLRKLGQEAAQATWDNIEKNGWPSLQGLT
jgi:NTE family protein